MLLSLTGEREKNYNDEAIVNIIANNCPDRSASVNYFCPFNPLAFLMEALEDNKKLYKRLLQAEREKSALPEKMLERDK